MYITEEKTYSMSLMLEEGSSNSGLNKKSYELEFTNRELLHAILTTGLPIHRLTPHYPGKRQADFLQKLSMVEIALETKGDRLKKSHALDFLDASEKGMIAYYIGMVFTKLISEKMFGMDYLTHINLIQEPSAEGYIDIRGMRRSDLIGYQRSQGYSLFGAVGRSENSLRALDNATKLAQSVKTVCGELPQHVAVCMTYYENSYFTAYIKAPQGEGAYDLGFHSEDYYGAYYRPILELFEELSAQTVVTQENNREVTLYLPYFQEGGSKQLSRTITVGMPEEIYQELQRGEYGRIATREPDTLVDEVSCIGRDYVYIK